MELNQRSLNALSGVHPALVKVVKRTAELIEDSSDLKFIVTEGLRTLERQKQLLADGKSKTLKSKHLTGHAVDLAVWFDYDQDKVVDSNEISWKFDFYKRLYKIVKQASEDVNVEIEWGGNWKSFVDAPHFQIDPETYKWKKEGV